ncbi:TetR/AcrR family transcriptional regulator [Marinactinospora thermotolerans]|uniref:Transcriptional regulator, TetR family n=1 Tax=Marinactinospora thermotolerans DSM 45154 TaxID=1122192 RepID=A0A1T4MBU9_9ACTN|nr:TetR/AcrR family transcriptional regulator [Marinactinospora thermotolerans]SJZ64351.1 transcriptional regulator, TetR family [Marinactinospora thermotolerans DSM 45154]
MDPLPPPRTGPPAGTRERILRESSRLFAEKGYHGASTRDIAAAVGIRQPSLFHHFPSKRAILEKLFEIDLAASLALTSELADQPGSAAVRLYRYVHAEAQAIVSSPYDLTGLYRTGVLSDPEFAHWREAYDATLSSIAGIVAQGVRQGEFVDIDPMFVTDSVDGLLLHLLRLSGGSPPGRSTGETEARRTADFVLRALLRDPADLDDVRAEARRWAGPARRRDVRGPDGPDTTEPPAASR